MNIRERFFQKIQKDPLSDCVLWTGADNQDGYGRMRDDEGRLRPAHHVSWFIKYGWWPRQLLHTCDNPPCVKPAHLVEGTQKENMRDMIVKGRQHHSTKLSDDQIVEIRGLCDGGLMSYREIGLRFGVHFLYVYSIYKRRTRDDGRPAPRKIDRSRLKIKELAARAGVTMGTIDARVERGLVGDALAAKKHRAPRKPYTRRK